MSKDLSLKIRLDEEDKKRLDVIAEHFSAPAATAVRILIKERYDAIRRKLAAGSSYGREDVRAPLPKKTTRGRPQ